MINQLHGGFAADLKRKAHARKENKTMQRHDGQRVRHGQTGGIFLPACLSVFFHSFSWDFFELRNCAKRRRSLRRMPHYTAFSAWKARQRPASGGGAGEKNKGRSGR
ncbi:hypothetical protein, partial [Candidatus Electronema sp. TJ]|uniref:hypothetical protein n=1 Tax=Candidatus Electronema sp. TJ TaxID=3401573 RepID=UPI003AA8B0B6